MTLDVVEQFPVGVAVAIVSGKKPKRGKVVGATITHSASYAYATVLVQVDGKVKHYRPSQLRRVEGAQDE